MNRFPDKEHLILISWSFFSFVFPHWFLLPPIFCIFQPCILRYHDGWLKSVTNSSQCVGELQWEKNRGLIPGPPTNFLWGTFDILGTNCLIEQQTQGIWCRNRALLSASHHESSWVWERLSGLFWMKDREADVSDTGHPESEFLSNDHLVTAVRMCAFLHVTFQQETNPSYYEQI